MGCWRAWENSASSQAWDQKLDHRSRNQPSEARSKSENKSMKMGVALQKCRCYGKLCFIKQPVKSGMGFISFHTPWRSSQEYETLTMLRKG